MTDNLETRTEWLAKSLNVWTNIRGTIIEGQKKLTEETKEHFYEHEEVHTNVHSPRIKVFTNAILIELVIGIQPHRRLLKQNKTVIAVICQQLCTITCVTKVHSVYFYLFSAMSVCLSVHGA